MPDRVVTELKGIGEKTGLLFNKVGVFSCDDLACYFPRSYIEYRECMEKPDISEESKTAIKAYVASKPVMRKNGRFTVVSCKLKCDNCELNAVWFNMPYISKKLKTGSVFIYYGYITKKGSKLTMEQPVIFTINEYSLLLSNLQPVYALTKGLTNQMVKKAVRQVLTDEQSDEYKMHFPQNYDELVKVRSRFVYEEFFLYILRLRFLKENNQKISNSFKIYPSSEVNRIIERLPYRLTDAQQKVISEIDTDITSGYSMNRLVQGDVGSGKTIVAFAAAITVAASNYQCAIMAPTEILAIQHYEGLTELLKGINSGIKCILLTGSMSQKDKKEAYKQIADNEAKIIIGTHALFQEKATYSSLALVITDEQHRFGVRQREELLKKNERDIPHLLVMSATPIPRSLALILYGDLNVSVIDEVPAKRLPIKNCVVNEDYRRKTYDFIEKEISAGHQAYVICPLVEESEGVDAKDAVSYTKELREIFPKSINIGCLHGQMKPADKNRVMNDFYNNDIQILVSTTVVEVGVNVPNASVMLIENAERFGLAQLHQLRGRIGRGAAQSYCIFLSGKRNPKIMERLKILNNSNNGFEIAQKDLELRGPGDLFGIRQSGDLEFKIADIFSDASLLKKASDDVDKLLDDDPLLEKDENSILREKLNKLMKEKPYTGL